MNQQVRGMAVERVAEELREAIRDGRLRPGARLGQAAVAKAFGISRLPVREALRALQSEGLVTLIPNAGAHVAKLSADELDEVYWLRELLEPALLAKSVPRLSDQQLQMLGRCVEEMEAVAQTDGDVAKWLEIDERFHFTSFAAAGLPQVLRLVESFWNVARTYRRAYAQSLLPTVFAVAHAEHRLLLDGFQRRDDEDAARLLTTHIRRTRLDLREHSELFA